MCNNILSIAQQTQARRPLATQPYSAEGPQARPRVLILGLHYFRLCWQWNSAARSLEYFVPRTPDCYHFFVRFQGSQMNLIFEGCPVGPMKHSKVANFQELLVASFVSYYLEACPMGTYHLVQHFEGRGVVEEV